MIEIKRKECGIMIVYKKVRVLKDGNYYPLFIDKTKPFEFGEWMKAGFILPKDSRRDRLVRMQMEMKSAVGTVVISRLLLTLPTNLNPERNASG